MKNLLLKQRGEGILTGLYGLLVLCLVFLLGVEILGYSMACFKIYSLGEETMELMKSENLFTPQMSAGFFRQARELNLDPYDLRVDGTPKRVQRGESLELNIYGTYPVKAVGFFSGPLEIPIHVKITGLAHQYIREEI